MRFVRKNALVISGSFIAADGSGTQPANAEVVIVYTSPTGPATQTIAMAQTGAIWSASWDSTVAVPCRVDWMAHCWGGLQAASQGSFELIANSANTG
jgi:hypothetical protein